MKKWKMPKWMKPYADDICNTGDNDQDRVKVVERLANGRTDIVINMPLAVLESCVHSQVLLLNKLHADGKLK